jgi:hypothetical protein
MRDDQHAVLWYGDLPFAASLGTAPVISNLVYTAFRDTAFRGLNRGRIRVKFVYGQSGLGPSSDSAREKDRERRGISCAGGFRVTSRKRAY